MKGADVGHYNNDEMYIFVVDGREREEKIVSENKGRRMEQFEGQEKGWQGCWTEHAQMKQLEC